MGNKLFIINHFFEGSLDYLGVAIATALTGPIINKYQTKYILGLSILLNSAMCLALCLSYNIVLIYIARFI